MPAGELLTSWQDPGTWDSGPCSEPPGRGKFLIKVGGHPGIPIKVELVEAERAINDTNKLWHATTAFPAPDESNPMIGLEDADHTVSTFAVRGVAGPERDEGAA